MESLPEELLAKILNYLPDPIAASQVSLYFKLVANTCLRSINIKLSSEKSHEIRFIQETLNDFVALRNLKLELSFDVNSMEKSKLCIHFCSKLDNLVLKEMTFLNPFFLLENVFHNLTSLTVENSDLSSSSNELTAFILNCCPKLTNLTITGCSGLDIDALENLGRNLNQTNIENFKLLPTYSYFDVTQEILTNQHWTIENLRLLSIRSKLVVMKKNFVQHLIGRRSEKLKVLELIGSLDLGEFLVPKIMLNYPNLEKISIGKGCSVVRNGDFSNISNYYKNLKSLEFHFAQSEEDLDLKSLERNESLLELTLGLTNNISMDSLAIISKCLCNVERLRIVLYYMSTSNQEFLTNITKIFPKIIHLEFQRTGMSENIRFSAPILQIKNEIGARPFEDIINLT